MSPFNSVKGFLLGFHLMVLNSPISYLQVINGSFFFTFAKTKQVNVILNGFILYLLKKAEYGLCSIIINLGAILNHLMSNYLF